VTGRSRRRLQLRAPSGSLAGYPSWTLRRTHTLYRAHKAGANPWWFSSDGSGRFDLRPPHGTCYLASGAQAAVRERWGQRLLALGYVPRRLAEDTELSQLRAAKGGRVADLCAADAAGFGVTREIGVTGRYDITQAWAKAFGPSGAQLLGVRYQPRFSTDARGWALGLFHDAGGASWPTDPHPHSGSTVAERLGIQVADLPTLSALSNALLVPPPPALP
jgi:hypothetical protein